MNDADLIEQMAILEARKSFWAYRQYIHMGGKKALKLGWWQRLIAYELQSWYEDFIAGKRPKLVIQAPPQHGKSEQIIDFVSWVAGKHPEFKTIYTSFSERLGVRANLRLQRIYDSPKFQKIFPECKIASPKNKSEFGKGVRNTDLIEYLQSEGSFRNTTVGGSITGESLDCLVAGTLIETDKGQIAIEKLHSLCYSVKALTYNNGELSFEEISGFKNTKSIGIFRITTESGRILECTGNHKFFTPETGGYTNASDLSENQTLLCLLQSGISKTCLRSNKMARCWWATKLLWDKLLQKTQANFNEKKMRGLPNSNRAIFKIWSFLFGLFKEKKGKETRWKTSLSSYKLPNLQQSIYFGSQRAWEICSLLWEALFGNRTLQIDGWETKSYVEGWCNPFKATATFRKSFQANEVESNKSGWQSLRCLFKFGKSFRGSSHRQLAYEQFIKKLNNAMSDVSCSNSHLNEKWGHDKIVSIERISIETDTYDIVVNKNHNFFANGILVHNCGIVDDPIKGREAANSLKIRDKVYEWLLDDFFSRFSEEAGFISILTRWHIDDPIGRLKSELGDKLKIISFPALATSNAILMPNDPREVGSDEPLFPEHKSKEFLLERKAIYHSSSWEALYQQNPIIIGGEIIKGHEFKRYVIPAPIKYRIIYGDTAQKTKERKDFSVLECWGYAEDGIYLLDLIRGKWEAPELKQKTVDFWNKHKAMSGLGALRKLKIEDKASGTGLIQDIKRNDLIPIEGIQRNIDKLTRVLDVVSYISAGRVFIPENAPYVNDFISECESFTADDSHLHDDQIDPMCDAINDMLLSKPKGFFT